MCFVDWTANLTQHFSRQRKNLSTTSVVTYQYFGGTLGSLRFFPGKQCFIYGLTILRVQWSHQLGTVWSTLNNCRRCPLPPVDTYRATERPWYGILLSSIK